MGVFAPEPGAVSMWAMCRHVAFWVMMRSRVDCATDVLYFPSDRPSVLCKGSLDVEVKSADRAMVKSGM